MDATASFKYLKRCLAMRLARCGFASKGDIIWRKANDTVVVIEIQRDLKHHTKEEARFTVNVAISVDALRSVKSADPSSSDVPIPERCHWRQRLGRLLPAQSDTWWTVRDEHSVQAVCEALGVGLIDIALPEVLEMASSEALLRAWQEGRGQGLTEFERRANLAKLLIATGRREQALAAVQDLEQASMGKSWAASAAYDAREMRKQLG